MFNGVHILFYSTDADADRAFFRETLGLHTIDIGHGWLIFGLPPAEAAVHPLDGEFPSAAGAMMGAHVYLMCESLTTTIAALAAKGVTCADVDEPRWGSRTTIPLPSGGTIGLYQPKHPTAI